MVDWKFAKTPDQKKQLWLAVVKRAEAIIKNFDHLSHVTFRQRIRLRCIKKDALKYEKARKRADAKSFVAQWKQTESLSQKDTMINDLYREVMNPLGYADKDLMRCIKRESRRVHHLAKTRLDTRYAEEHDGQLLTYAKYSMVDHHVRKEHLPEISYLKDVAAKQEKERSVVTENKVADHKPVKVSATPSSHDDQLYLNNKAAHQFKGNEQSYPYEAKANEQSPTLSKPPRDDQKVNTATLEHPSADKKMSSKQVGSEVQTAKTDQAETRQKTEQSFAEKHPQYTSAKKEIMAALRTPEMTKKIEKSCASMMKLKSSIRCQRAKNILRGQLISEALASQSFSTRVSLL